MRTGSQWQIERFITSKCLEPVPAMQCRPPERRNTKMNGAVFACIANFGTQSDAQRGKSRPTFGTKPSRSVAERGLNLHGLQGPDCTGLNVVRPKVSRSLSGFGSGLR